MYEAVLDPVPDVTFRVSLTAGAPADRFVYEEVRAGQTVLFTLPEPRPAGIHGFEVHDAATGEPLEGYSVVPVHPSWGPAADFPFSARPDELGAHTYASPPQDIEWCVEHPGYQRAYGRGSAFVDPSPSRPGHWAHVRLARGFGVRLRVRDSTDGRFHPRHPLLEVTAD